jgi:hypothetical protein
LKIGILYVAFASIIPLILVVVGTWDNSFQESGVMYVLFLLCSLSDGVVCKMLDFSKAKICKTCV